MLAEKPLISEETDLLEPTLLDELICNISTLASVYHKPPSSFVEGRTAARRFTLPPRAEPSPGAQNKSNFFKCYEFLHFRILQNFWNFIKIECCYFEENRDVVCTVRNYMLVCTIIKAYINYINFIVHFHLVQVLRLRKLVQLLNRWLLQSQLQSQLQLQLQ